MGKIVTCCSYLLRFIVVLIAIFFGSAFLFHWNSPKHSSLIGNPHGNDLAPNFRGEKGEYFKNKDNLWIHYDEYLPHQNPRDAKGLLLMLHGLDTHAGMYADTAQKIADSTNLIVITQDHQGWGLSEGDRLYFEYVSDLRDDFHQLVEMKKKEHNISKNVFCFGHSFSANLLIWDHLNGLHSHQPQLCQGVVLSALGVVVDPALEDFLHGSIGQGLSYLSGFFPKMIVLKLIGVAELTSSLPSFHEAWNNDPLVHAFLRLRTSFNFVQILTDNAKNDVNKVTAPFFLFTGSEDQLVPPASLQSFTATVASKDKTFKLYEGDYHSVLHDKHAATAVEDISRWLKQHMSNL